MLTNGIAKLSGKPCGIATSHQLIFDNNDVSIMGIYSFVRLEPSFFARANDAASYSRSKSLNNGENNENC